MLWYSEQQVNACYGIKSNKEINAKGNSSNKEINALVSGTNILENFDLSKIFQLNFFFKCPLTRSIFGIKIFHVTVLLRYYLICNTRQLIHIAYIFIIKNT